MQATILPYHLKIDQTIYADFNADYHQIYRTLVLSTTVQNGDRTVERKEVYRVINLTDDYLVLEEVLDTFCFDFSTGKILTQKECKEKAKKEPKRLFGGSTLTIGGKSPKRRLVFALK